jgi:hypothetical protein
MEQMPAAAFVFFGVYFFGAAGGLHRDRNCQRLSRRALRQERSGLGNPVFDPHRQHILFYLPDIHSALLHH